MMKLFKNKKIVIIYTVLALIFVVFSIAMMIRNAALDVRFKREQYIFYPGLIATDISLLFGIFLLSKNKITDLVFFRKTRWLLLVISIPAIILLVRLTYDFFYILKHNLFVQLVGHDQEAFWNQNALLFHFSIAAILMNIFASITTIFMKAETAKP